VTIEHRVWDALPGARHYITAIIPCSLHADAPMTTATRRLVAHALVIAAISTAAASAYAQIPESAYQARRGAVLAKLGRDILIVPARGSFLSDDEMGFVQAPDFQYLTGLAEQVGAVLVLDGSDATVTLFVARPSALISLAIIPPSAASAQMLHMNGVLPVDSLEPRLRPRFASAPTNVYIAGVDPRGAVPTPLPMANSVTRWRAWVKSLGAADGTSAIPVLRPLREIKSAEEIAILRKVGRASSAAFLAGIQALHTGQTQRVAELDVVNACVAAGARGVSFWPWTMSGPNAQFMNLFSSFQSYEHIDRVMQRGEVVRVDVGCQADHYMGDVGRTAPVSGRFTSGQREAWNLFIAGYLAGLPLIKDGAATADVFAAAIAAVRGRKSYLRTPQGKHAAKVLLAANGTSPWEIHGVGLDDAEGQPDTLRAGMTVAYELMFVVDGDGFYLEDMIAVGRNDNEVLTPGLPYTASEIQAAMRAGPKARRR
jgi:Xaa-Pro aminopeptidase